MNETLTTIHNLATTHGNFTDRPIRAEDLDAVIAASLRAATASARQSYSLVVVEDRQMIRELCGYAGAAGIVYCVDYNRLLDTYASVGEAYEVNGMLDFITGSTDTILAAQSGAIAARSLGLDYLFTNGIHRGDVGRVYRLLDLPEQHCFALIMLVLGYGEHAAAPKGRLNGPGIVHRGKYARITADRAQEIVAAYDDPKNHLGFDAGRDANYAHYFNWFIQDWTHPEPERAVLFEELLRKTGFMKG